MFFILSNNWVINGAQRARCGVLNRIKSNLKMYRLIEKIKVHINDITAVTGTGLMGDLSKKTNFPTEL